MAKALAGGNNMTHQRQTRTRLADTNKKINAIRTELRSLLQDVGELTIPELASKLRTEQEMKAAALKMVAALGTSKTKAAKEQLKQAGVNVKESQKLIHNILELLKDATTREDVEIASSTGSAR